MEEPFDDHGCEVPPGLVQSWQEPNPMWTLLRVIEERPGSWDLDLL